VRRWIYTEADTLCFLVGQGLVIAGVVIVCVPAALIIGGGALMADAVAVARRKP